MAASDHDDLLVVRLPAEIDIANADQVRDLLSAARLPGVTVVIADLTSTCFCDSSGISGILAGRKLLAASGAELRLAVQPGIVRRVIRLHGIDLDLPVYPTVLAAAGAATGPASAEPR